MAAVKDIHCVDNESGIRNVFNVGILAIRIRQTLLSVCCDALRNNMINLSNTTTEMVIALLIDGDNVQSVYIDAIEKELAILGIRNVFNVGILAIRIRQNVAQIERVRVAHCKKTERIQRPRFGYG